MEKKSLNSYTKSLTAGSSIVSEAFPNLTIRSCISEASESLNGPRYAAQDKHTFFVHEVRYNTVEVSEDTVVYPIEKEESPVKSLTDRRCWLDQQEERMRQLRLCAKYNFPFVSFPQSVYLYASPTNAGCTSPSICSVEEFCGLSLGDILRSGWTVVEESLLNDVLEAVEVFGKMIPVLPPHANISADAIKQLLMLREKAVEGQHRSRWVVSDWLLSPPSEEHYDLFTTISDIEWMLTSAFSQCHILNDATGTILSPSDLEYRIGTMTSRLRDELALRFGTSSSTVLRAGDALENKEEVEKYLRAAIGEVNYAETPSVSSTVVTSSSMPIRDRLACHQNALRQEQQHLNRYRRKYAQLPPRPPSVSGEADYRLESEEYKPKELVSPIMIKPSALFYPSASVLKNPPLSHADNPRTKRLSKRSKLGSRRRERQKKSATLREQQERDPSKTPEDIRELVIDDIVQLAIQYEEQAARKRRILEEEAKMQREGMCQIVLRSASCPSLHARGSADTDPTPRKGTSRVADARGKDGLRLFPAQLKNIFALKLDKLTDAHDMNSSVISSERSSTVARSNLASRRRTLNFSATVSPLSNRSTSSSSSSVRNHPPPPAFTGAVVRASSAPSGTRGSHSRPLSTGRRFPKLGGVANEELAANSRPSLKSSFPVTALSSAPLSNGWSVIAASATSVSPTSVVSSTKDSGLSVGNSPYKKGRSSGTPKSMMAQARRESSPPTVPAISNLSSSHFPSPRNTERLLSFWTNGSLSGVPPSSLKENIGHAAVRLSSGSHSFSDGTALPTADGFPSVACSSYVRDASLASFPITRKKYHSASTGLHHHVNSYHSSLRYSRHRFHHRSQRAHSSGVSGFQSSTKTNVLHVPKTIYVTRHANPKGTANTVRNNLGENSDEKERPSSARGLKQDPKTPAGEKSSLVGSENFFSTTTRGSRNVDPLSIGRQCEGDGQTPKKRGK